MLHNATILGKIFVHLPMRDILVNIQRTCRLWRNVVRDTDKVQKALFLKPISQKGLIYMSEAEAKKGAGWLGRVGKSAEIFEHPLATRGDTALRKYYIANIGGRAEASWRRMLISQPPMKAVIASQWVNGEQIEKFIVAKSVGITLGEVVEAFHERNVFYVTFQGYQAWKQIQWTKDATWPLLETGTKGVRRGRWREVKDCDDVAAMGEELIEAAKRSRISADAKMEERYDVKMEEAKRKKKERASFASSRKS
ncbi:hypothetical protein DOTSEDRAFT_75287 [Dothistroma septosporum NZE10]|uniref:F-box domain-containing protein n=1 Tax=Dothistroma septosporum (strain NZE10 / CBS 128990) TaxID=675120 RepID=M2WKR6_DOTSN|nr:hypothetical protein DOTSEDRAFT_75287 [Dothistroma septosporum NZE10]